MISKLGLAIGAATTVLASSLTYAAATKENVVRWPYGVVPYEINQAAGDSFTYRREMWQNAVQHWNTETDLTFVDISNMSDAERAQYPIFVEFNFSKICDAPLGYFDSSSAFVKPPFFGDKGTAPLPTDGTQKRLISNIANGCAEKWRDGIVDFPEALFTNGAGATHEIGHVVGLIHEHQRSDQQENIFYHDDRRGAFTAANSWTPSKGTIHISEYDYLSTMHYYPHQANHDDLNDLDSSGYVLSFDPSENPSGEDIAKSDRLHAGFPDYARRMAERTGLSPLDISSVNHLYRQGLADVLADSFKQVSYCKDADFEDGKCSSLRELVVASTAANLGPWDSQNVTITHLLHPNFKAADLEGYTSNADSCELTTVSYCTGDSCSDLDAFSKLDMCKSGGSSDCSPNPAFVCESSSLTPMEVINTEFTLTHPENKTHKYAVVVSASGSEDDMASNNSITKTMASGGSMSVSALLAGLVMMYRRRRFIRK